MISPSRSQVVGLLVSGGLDSGILLGHLLERGRGNATVLRSRDSIGNRTNRRRCNGCSRISPAICSGRW